MKIKYNGYADQIIKHIDLTNQSIQFKRNTWRDIPEHLAIEVLKDRHFISEEDNICKLPKMKKSMTLGFHRWGAWGDLLMLIPVVKFIKKEYHHKIVLITQPCHIEFFKDITDLYENVVSQSNFDGSKYDKIVFLDGVLESDHSLTNYERHKHRIHLYEEFFGIHIDKHDFSIQIKHNESVEEILNACIQQHEDVSDHRCSERLIPIGYTSGDGV